MFVARPPMPLAHPCVPHTDTHTYKLGWVPVVLSQVRGNMLGQLPPGGADADPNCYPPVTRLADSSPHKAAAQHAPFQSVLASIGPAHSVRHYSTRTLSPKKLIHTYT